MRKNEIENASGGEEECVFRGLGVLSVSILTEQPTNSYYVHVVCLG
ncbi:hypothetical protein VCHA37P200_50261 [Vibrio chagasii]|nr:hypothetical protein VCHA53O468_50077 [Vibrio chagasii]CAH7327164.1 hypothetical protein VCHA55O507_50076 [Vibrio chagasii]CAH7445508.1 hypothetical protein VCHA37P200_50261 [Vibrio chagasii]CAH7461149.1 hypothetical protein VCHA43P274_50077 [Vibrio chagasii]